MLPTSIAQSVIGFEEPPLEFAYNQTLSDPRHGLSLFGPYDLLSTSRSSLGYVLIGTETGVDLFDSWAVEMNSPTTYAPGDNHRLWVPFPGFEESFGVPFPTGPIRKYILDSDTLLYAARQSDPHERVFKVVELYLNCLERTRKLDEQVGVGICVIPEEVWRNCRPHSTVKDAVGWRISSKQKTQLKAGQRDLFYDFDEDQFLHSTDFRRQLKARGMEYGFPLQLVRETTLRCNGEAAWGSRALTPLSDRKWNLATAHYYKCGGKPWRLLSARSGVCYVGIAFRKSDDESTACCAAQLFLTTGDGIVFLGEFGPWYSPKTRQFKLTREAAFKLLDGVLRTYKEQEGQDLAEVFIHARSSIGQEEFAGFREACPDNVNLVGIRVRVDRRRGVKLFRSGKMPVLRGTFWKANDSTGYLWGTGYKPDIGTYDGWEVPLPMRIDIQYGDALIERVAHDILGLTKLNYNACHIGDAEPVTIKYSDAVGEILISNPRAKSRKSNFKYYI